MPDEPTAGERRQRLEAILDEVLESGPGSDALDQACAADPELRAQVVHLLNESASATNVETLGRTERESMPRLEGLTVGPYELLRRIGVGGMGEVYEAEDTRLRRRVALKFLPPGYSRDAAKQRFLREARAASALDHSGICTLYDIGESDDGRLYIVMAYYPGETLLQQLERGPLPIADARRIAIQVARGLQHAHEAGIIHRDIKPANVVLTQGGEAKILDFGVAKVHDATVLTHSGAYLGTPIYMSPEQSRGEEVDARTDLWSLGVMLYEMLTCRRPFGGDDVLAIMNAIATRSPAPVEELRPEVPAALAATVRKLMAKDPADRYASAAELLADLGTGTGPVATVTEASPERRWHPAAVAVAAAVVAVILLLAIPASRQALLPNLAAAPGPGPRLVAVLPFVNNLTPTPENQALTAGLTHSLTGMIARMGAVGDSLWVVPADEIARRGVTTAAEARTSFGVDAVLAGSVQQLGPTMEILLSLIDPGAEPPRILDSRTVPAPLSPPLSAQALHQLADLMGVGVAAQALLGPDRSADTTPAAYSLYLQGLGFLERYDQPDNLERAAAAFTGALGQDPLYGPAHAGLCEALWETYRQTDDRALTDRALASCDRAAELAAGHASVLVAVGKIYYETGRTKKAAAELERALVLEPDNAEAYRYKGWVASREGRPQEAEAALRRAIDLKPRLSVYYSDLGIILSHLGRYEEAAELFEEYRRLTPENYLAYNALGVARFDLHQVEESERLFRRSIELQPNPLAYRNLGYNYFRELQYDRAVEVLEEARRLHEEAPSFNDWIVWSWLGHAYYWAGDKAAAAAAWRRLIEIATPLYDLNLKDTNVLMLLADAHVALGEAERGRFYLNRLVALPIDAVSTRFYIGRIWEMLGDRELALSYITQALADRFDPWTVDRDPWLEQLRTEPAYQDLRRQYLPSTDQES